MQAWKKTSAFIRSHNWYADILRLDWEALRIEAFIAEIRRDLKSGNWYPTPISMIPAPKTQRWGIKSEKWQPLGTNGKAEEVKIRPLAHVDLKDQVVATALMLCLADSVENAQSDPTGRIKTVSDRRSLRSYGNRLFCSNNKGILRHRWGSQKLYRAYSSDYQRFLERPLLVAEQEERELKSGSGMLIAVVQADLSRFYDRVRPGGLARALERFQTESDGTSQTEDERHFFDLSRRVFNWTWVEPKRAEDYARQADISGYTHVALPQGLVASGFFSNVMLIGFDEAMGMAIRDKDWSPEGMEVLDACRYVDDLRIVLRVPETLSEVEIGKLVSGWLNKLLSDQCPGLLIEGKKTVVTVRGREAAFAVPQSRSANRIQHQLSGGFDAQQGVQIIDAIEGFLHTQIHYSPEQEQRKRDQSVLRGVSDMRDDTAARFAAGRFRRTFRSLRPLLDCREPVKVAGKIVAGERLLSRQELDERAHVFALGLIEDWESDPAQMRLLRIALDLHPSRELCERVLNKLRPAWFAGKGSPRGGRKEVMIYCLADLFRAGATETGIVGDDEMLPDSSDVEGYHDALLDEATSIIANYSKGAKSRLPWYLMQQVLLYLATRGSAWLVKYPRSRFHPNLQIYSQVHTLLNGKYPQGDETRACLEVILAKSFGMRAERAKILAKEKNPVLFKKILLLDPGLAEEIWNLTTRRFQRSLAKTGVPFARSRNSSTVGEEKVCAALLPMNSGYVWHDEENLVRLTKELLEARKNSPEGVLTPWRVYCSFNIGVPGPIRERLKEGTVEIMKDMSSSSLEESFFQVPTWCTSAEDCRRVEVGKVLRYLLVGSVDYFSSRRKSRRVKRSLPRYRAAASQWQQCHYGSFNGRSAFGPDWLPLSSFTENLLLELLRWPGCSGTRSRRNFTSDQVLAHRLGVLKKARGEATGMLFLEQEAAYRGKGSRSRERRLRIAVVQSVIPNDGDFIPADPCLDEPSIRRRHRRHIASVLQGLRQMFLTRLTHLGERTEQETVDLVILPELSLHPDDVAPLVYPLVRDFRCIVLAGLVYHRAEGSLGDDLINSALWVIPEWAPQTGLQIRRVEQGKQHLARLEREIPGLNGFRPTQWVINYRWHTEDSVPPLLLSASICYDATDTCLAADMRDRNDLLAICALNQDVQTFDNLAETLNYHLFQGVIVVNNGRYGGSNFYAPVKDRPRDGAKREILHFHGQPQALIGFAEIDPPKLIFRPNMDSGWGGNSMESLEPKGAWKEKPAGWTGPHGVG